jgi:hypothetical protein
MNSKKMLIYGGLILAGVVLSSRIRQLPGGSKIPTV